MNNEDILRAIKRISEFNLSKLDTPIGEFIKVETPFLYSDRDVISVFIEARKKGFVVTDLGETFRWIHDRLVNPSLSDQQIEQISQILDKYGVSKDKNLLFLYLRKYVFKDSYLSIINMAKAISDISHIEI